MKRTTSKSIMTFGNPVKNVFRVLEEAPLLPPGMEEFKESTDDLGEHLPAPGIIHRPAMEDTGEGENHLLPAEYFDKQTKKED